MTHHAAAAVLQQAETIAHEAELGAQRVVEFRARMRERSPVDRVEKFAEALSNLFCKRAEAETCGWANEPASWKESFRIEARELLAAVGEATNVR